MKKYPVLCLLLLSLLVSACGGGGGGSGVGISPDTGASTGGNSGNGTNTGGNAGDNNNDGGNSGGNGGGDISSSLPEITSTDGATITAMPYAVSTEGEATQLVQNSLDSNFYSQNGVSLSSVQFQDVKHGCADKKECNKMAFGRMKKYLIDQNFAQLSSADPDELRDALLLAGYQELPNNCQKNQKSNCTLAHLLKNLNETIFNELKENARRRYENYGGGVVTLENAKLAFNDDTEDAYVRFSLDKDNKIESMTIDHEERSEKLIRDLKDDKFKGNFKTYQYGIVVGVDCEKGACSPAAGRAIVLESEEKLTNIDAIKAGLLKKLQDEYEDGDFNYLHGGTDHGQWQEGDVEKLVEYTKERINALTMDDFDRTDMDNLIEEHTYYNEETAETIAKYNSFAKDMKLSYSDFGNIEFDENFSQSSRTPGNSENIKTVGVFSGGYEAKRIDPSLIKDEINFKGRAIGAVTYSEEDNHIESANVVTKPLSLDGDLDLNFKNGQETLNAKFNNWYNVTVTNNLSDPSKRDIAFSNGQKITDSDFKFRGQDTYVVSDMKGEQQIRADGDVRIVEGSVTDYVTGESEGNVRIDYYGDMGKPSEATGYVGYSESVPFQSTGSGDYDRIKTLDMQVSFGAKKQQ